MKPTIFVLEHTERDIYSTYTQVVRSYEVYDKSLTWSLLHF